MVLTAVNVTLSRGAAERLVARPATAMRARVVEFFMSISYSCYRVKPSKTRGYKAHFGSYKITEVP
jgi:hypothetical protein